jgi:Fe-S cluster biogenesis protein NfuA
MSDMTTLTTGDAGVIEREREMLNTLIEYVSGFIEMYHGGSVEIVDYDGETLKVRFGGACIGCHMAAWTLRMTVERTVCQFFPGLKNVIAV